MRSNVRFILIIAIAGLIFGACSSLKTPPIQKNYFDLAIKKQPPISKEAARTCQNIMIKTLAIAPEYDTHSFIYKVEEERFFSDFYNEFVSAPNRIITEKISEALYATKHFSPYLAQHKNQVSYRLFGKITHMYFDLMQSNAHAVLEIRFTLEKNTPTGFETIFSKTYSESQPAPSKDPAEMANTMSLSLTQIAKELMNDICKPIELKR